MYSIPCRCRAEQNGGGGQWQRDAAVGRFLIRGAEGVAHTQHSAQGVGSLLTFAAGPPPSHTALQRSAGQRE